MRDEQTYQALRRRPVPGRLIRQLGDVPFVQETVLRSGVALFPRGTLDGAGPLSVREVQALGGLSVGMLAGEVADVLGVSVATVKKALRSAYYKLGVPRSGGRLAATRAVATAIRRGYL